jgi:hypothetical protein
VRISLNLYDKDLIPLFLNLIVLSLTVTIFFSISFISGDLKNYKGSGKQEITTVLTLIAVIFIPVFVISAISDLIIKYYTIQFLIKKRHSGYHLFQKMFLYWNTICVCAFLLSKILINMNKLDPEFFIIFVILFTSLISSLLLLVDYKLYSLIYILVIILSLILLVIIISLSTTLMSLIFLSNYPVNY